MTDELRAGMTDSVVAKMWDMLVAGGWTPPKRPSDAVTLVMGLLQESPVVLEETKRVGAIETRTRIYGDNGWPPGFAWLNEPVEVSGEDFRYFATALVAFPKLNGKIRYVVEDNGRLFIQKAEQLKFIPKSEPPPHGPILDDMDNELAGRAPTKIVEGGGPPMRDEPCKMPAPPPEHTTLKGG